MKPTTQNILSVLNSNLETHIKRFIEENKWPNHQHMELDAEGLLDLYIEVKGVLQDAAENGELDNISYHQRNTIWSQINAFKTNTEAITKSAAHFNNASTYIQHIQMHINQSSLSENGSKHRLYEKKLNELKAVNKEYENLKKSLETADSLSLKGRVELEAISKTLNTSKDILLNANLFCEEKMKNIEKTISLVEQQHQTIKTNKDEIDTLYTNSNTNADEITKMKDKVVEFSGNINRTEEKLEKWGENYKTLIKNLKTLVDENEQQKVKIDDLIEHATGASLFHAFDKKRDRLKTTLGVWLLGLMMSLGWLTYVGTQIAFVLADKSTTVDSLLLFKISTSLPVIYFVFFCSNQYSKNKNLLEEYSFKSTLSLSLEPYRNLVNDITNDDEKSKMTDFLIKAIDRIYESPTKNVFKYVQEDKKVMDISALSDLVKQIRE